MLSVGRGRECLCVTRQRDWFENEVPTVAHSVWGEMSATNAVYSSAVDFSLAGPKLCLDQQHFGRGKGQEFVDWLFRQKRKKGKKTDTDEQ